MYSKPTSSAETSASSTRPRASRVLSSMRETEEGRNAAIIGRVSAGYPGKLVMGTAFGGKRILQKLTGAQLPRIC